MEEERGRISDVKERRGGIKSRKGMEAEKEKRGR